MKLVHGYPYLDSRVIADEDMALSQATDIIPRVPIGDDEVSRLGILFDPCGGGVFLGRAIEHPTSPGRSLGVDNECQSYRHDQRGKAAAAVGAERHGDSPKEVSEHIREAQADREEIAVIF